MQLCTRLTLAATALSMLAIPSYATATDGSVVVNLPKGAAEGNYVLMTLKDGTQDTLYPYVDYGAHCMPLDKTKTYTGGFQLFGSISCRFYKGADCTGAESAWFPAQRQQASQDLKTLGAIACHLPMAGEQVKPLPSD